MILNGVTSYIMLIYTSWCPNTKCGNTIKTRRRFWFKVVQGGLSEANFQIDKEEISTNTARKGFETS
jgi:hypothetical protein